ncbi:MAG: hypothetical protein M1835_001325 [Candelina submexicana]|nr:MAG: hypothetical protein M1835_001325 [Candelina submexicana]
MPGDARHRVGTSRQIRRHYQKNGPRVSEAEVRRAQRGCELQQRAERIQKAERQRKINQRKKEEKEQKDREARKRMGIPEPAIGCVGPSQIRMSQFFGREERRKEGKAHVTTHEEASTLAAALANIDWDALNEEDSDVDIDQHKVNICRARNNAVSHGKPASQTIKGQSSSTSSGAQGIHLQEKQEEKKKKDCEPPAAVKAVLKSNQTPQSRMDGIDSLPSAMQNDTEAHLPAHLSQAEVIVRIDEPWDEETELVEDWNNFLVSNTQIEREISLVSGQKLPMTQSSSPMSSFPDLDSTDEEPSDPPSPGPTQRVAANANNEEERKSSRSPSRLGYMPTHASAERVHLLQRPSKAIIKGCSGIVQSPRIESAHQTAISDRFSDFDDPELDDLLQEYPTSTAKPQQLELQPSRPIQTACLETPTSVCYALPDDFLMSTQELRDFTE